MSPLVAVQFLLCPLVLIALIRTTAPYGRHYQAGWGPALPNRMAWFLMELPALLVITGVILAAGASGRAALWLPWFLWTAHYAYRTLLFPLLIRTSSRSFPILLIGFAWGFNTLNGYNNGQALIDGATSAGPFLSWYLLLGTGVFVAGFVTHAWADARIRALRAAGPECYGVPQGGLFRWVSNPNYLGEIVQWAGWALLTWSWAGLAFAVFTACNLVPRAVANHRWYQNRFPDYPRDRKIVLPFIY